MALKVFWVLVFFLLALSINGFWLMVLHDRIERLEARLSEHISKPVTIIRAEE